LFDSEYVIVPSGKSIEESKENPESKNEEVKEDDIKLEFEESKTKGKGTNAGSDNKFPSQSQLSINASLNDDNEDDEEEEKKENKTDEELEEEKQLLLKMNWNIHFTIEEFNEANKEDEALQSEKQAYENQLKKEKEFGKKFWNLIGYILFFNFFIYIVFSQIRMSMYNMYNDALRDNLAGIYIEGDEGDFLNITSISTYLETNKWLVDGIGSPDKLLDINGILG